MKVVVLGAILILLGNVISKQIFISYSSESQSIDLFKYFHSVKSEFYVDIGAYDPIFASNTIQLQNWNGVNVEASLKRHRNFVASRPHQINLNMAVTNGTGGHVTLVQYGHDSMASINQEFAKSKSDPSMVPLMENTSRITMGDLCHQYYPKRPKLMTLDIEGHGLVALQFNDWSDEKCLPEVICAQRILEPVQDRLQRQLIQSHGYVFQKASHLNEIYIHQHFVDVYKERQAKGIQLLNNMVVYQWFPLFQQMFRTIIPTADVQFRTLRHIDPRTYPIYLHFASQDIISVKKLIKKSFFLSGTVRPLLILHYNPLKSKLYIGSNDYKLTKIKVLQLQFEMHLIQVSYSDQKTLVYVLDHNFESPNPLEIIDNPRFNPSECTHNPFSTQLQSVEVDNHI